MPLNPKPKALHLKLGWLVAWWLWLLGCLIFNGGLLGDKKIPDGGSVHGTAVLATQHGGIRFRVA